MFFFYNLHAYSIIQPEMQKILIFVVITTILLPD